MNDEKSGAAEDRRENSLNNSNSSSVSSDGHEAVQPPDSKKFHAEMDEITERIRVLEAKLKSLEKQMASSSAKPLVAIDTEKLLSELQDLRAQREKVIEERKHFDLELKGLNIQVQKKNDACTKLQAGVRYKSEARIDEAVRRLEHQMQTQLTLSEEKRLVAEINILKRSKRNLSEYLALKQHVDQLRHKQMKLRNQRDACVKRINGLKSREEEIKNLLDSDDGSETEEAQSQYLEQLNEIEALKKELDELRLKKRNFKTNFTKDRNDYYAAVREMKSQKQKEEQARRKKERHTMLQEVTRTRGKLKPYEKERALCDTLMGHLEKLHTNFLHLPDPQAFSSSDKEPSLSPNEDFPKSDGEGTYLRRKSATDDLVGVFAGSARSPRRGSRKGRRSSAKEVPRKLNLNLEVVEQLFFLSVAPPVTAADIPKVLEELQEKKDFYERAQTSHSVLAPPNNDPMSPITEEVAPEFPSTFKRSSETENSKEDIQGEDITAVKNDTRDGDVHNNPQGNHNEVNLSSNEDEEVACNESVHKSNTNSLSSLSPKTEGEVASLKKTGVQEECTSDANSALETQPASNDTCNCEADSGESAIRNPITSSNEHFSEICDGLCPVNEDVHGLDEPMINPVENGKVSLEEEQIIHSANTQNGGVTSKESCVPELINCSNFTGSSQHGSSLLIDENGLDTAYDRNSLNEGGNIVNVHCEKCPA